MSDPVFFKPARAIDVAGVAELTSATPAGDIDPQREIVGLASLNEGGAGRLVFADGRKARALLPSLTAAAILCTPDMVDAVPAGIAILVTAKPQHAFAQVARSYFPDAVTPAPVLGQRGISAASHISEDAHVAPGATVEAGAVIGPGASVGAGTVIAATAVIGAGCQIGRNCFVGPGASLQAALIGDRVVIHAGVRVGTDGFGFVAGRGGLEKVPQIGRVVIQDNVEIGANSTIDRGALDDTVIGEGTKIDNLVQIAHNVRIGRSCAIAAHCGISGSVTIGDYVLLGGRVGIGDHITIGTGAQLAGNSGVMNDVPAGARWGGFPAQPVKSWLREVSSVRTWIRQKGKGSNADG